MRAYGFYDSAKPLVNLAGSLPHWRQEGVIYFVTFRLADSLPQEKLERWREERNAWLQLHPFPHDESTHDEYVKRFVVPMERWLDAGYGSCVLGDVRCRKIVEQSLRFFEGQRYTLDRFVVMPNHAHVLIAPYVGWELSDLIGSVKGYTAHQINGLIGRTGQLWQEEPFDHIVRSEVKLEKFRKYIEDNPKWWKRRSKHWERR